MLVTIYIREVIKMLQVIKKEFEKLDNLVEYINRISIIYGHLKDYKILKFNGSYNLLMNFDVPEVKLNLELAYLKKIDEKECQFIYNQEYEIILEDKSRYTFACIQFEDRLNGIEIGGSFGIKETFSLIIIEYEERNKYFKIELRNFQYNEWWHTREENTLLVKEVDYKTIYNHLIKLIFNRGYLLNYRSYQELNQVIYYKVEWLNRKGFKKFKVRNDTNGCKK